MFTRLLHIVWIAIYVTLAVWQFSRQAYGIAFFDVVLVIGGIWFYGENVIDEVRRGRR